MSSTDIYIAVVGGGQGVYSAGPGISIISAGGQFIAGVVSAAGRFGAIGGAIATNPAAGLITLVKIGTDASNEGKVNVGDAISVVGNSVSIAAAICAVVPGGQPVALALGLIGRSMALAGLGVSLMDVNYPISPTVNTATTSALTWEPFIPAISSPIILDLDGGGISNSGIEPGYPILFDHDGDGLRNATGWVGAGEAIVVRDLNGNGTIDSGRELFGDNTLLTRGPKAGQRAADGFEALADLDSNNDGQFNAADAAFASVKLWKDANQNGISEAGELFTFAQLGVQGIKVAGKRDGTALTDALGAPTGNTQTLVGSFTWANGGSGQAGTTALAADLIFATNAFFRRFSDDPTPTAAALALPNMQGSGLSPVQRAAGEALRER